MKNITLSYDNGNFECAANTAVKAAAMVSMFDAVYNNPNFWAYMDTSELFDIFKDYLEGNLSEDEVYYQLVSDLNNMNKDCDEDELAREA